MNNLCRRELAKLVMVTALANASPSLARGETREIRVRNREAVLKVRIDGRGPPVLLIPSLGRGASDFDDLAARLTRAGFCAIRLEPRGIGGSSGRLDGVTLDDLAEDAAAALTGAGATSAVVVGHAFGNRVARRLASMHPDRVRALVLLAAGGKVRMAPEIEAALLRCFQLDLPDTDRLRDIQLAFFAPGNDSAVWRSGWWPEAAAAQRAATQRTPVDLWWRGGGRPILILQGDEDVLAPPANAELLKKELGEQVTLIRIEHSGHAMLPEQPAVIADAAIAFARRYSC